MNYKILCKTVSCKIIRIIDSHTITSKTCICISTFFVLTLSYFAIDHFANANLPILLWWTVEPFPHIGYNDLTLIKCGDVKCHSTNKKHFFNDQLTKGILFYGTGISPQDLPLPRNVNHEWGLFHEESPLNNYILSQENFMQLFNHTATFKRESDYPLSTQDVFSMEYLMDRKPVDIQIKNMKRKNEGFAALMYTQSHVSVPSFRDMYVKELMKYIEIDSYGACLHNKDLPDNLSKAEESFQKDEFLDFIANYKFHLSFENAVCDDYMTEKLMRPLHLGSVPVYYGSPKAKDWMPNNNSIIMVNDFKTPKELAEFIKYLDENDEEYLKYLNFKKPHAETNTLLKDTVLNRNWGTHDYKYYYYNIEDKVDYYQGFECYVCKEIHKRLNAVQEYEIGVSKSRPLPKMANNTHLGCPKPFSPLTDQEMPSAHWTFIYEDSKILADAVVEMLHGGETDSSKIYSYHSKLQDKQNSHNTGDL